MKEQRKDRRVVRTRHRLFESLLTLILEKGYEQVTVQDILDHADVGRSTFYTHFLNKADLLMGNLKPDLFSLGPKQTPAQMPNVSWMFEHTAENLQLYRALSGTEVMALIYHNLNEGLQRNWRELLLQMAAEGKTIDLPVEAAAAFLSNALIGLLLWWIDNRFPHDAQEMDRIFQRLARQGLGLLD